jgi:hypothetical protein
MMEKNSTLTTPYLNCESIGPWKKMEQSLQKKYGLNDRYSLSILVPFFSDALALTDTTAFACHWNWISGSMSEKTER